MNFFTRLILRQAGWVVFLSIVLSVVGAYFSAHLYKNLRPDMEELLPTSARSVIDLNEVTTRLESTENLAVIIFSDSPKESLRFVIDLADRLQKLPKGLVASVEYRIDRELAFFQKRKSLYMEQEDLVSIRDYIKKRIDYERELFNPLNIFRTTEIPEPVLDILSLRNKYDKKVSAYTRFPGGFYATPDEKIRVVLVNLAGKLSGIHSAKALRAAVDQTIGELHPQSYSPDLTVKFSGGVQNLIEEHASLMADLELSTVIVFVLVTLVLYLYFRTLQGTLVLTLSLLVGTFWTFGVSYFAVGYLNANSAFLGAIVLGNGINFGIIFLARYIEERRRKADNTRAVYIALRKTLTATAVAALAAGLAYGSLTLTGFRGFRQFGLVGLIGMILCWISAYTTLPALLIVMNRFWPLSRKKFQKTTKPILSDAVARLIEKRPKTILALSIALTLLSIVSYFGYNGEILQTDLSKLRDKESMERGSAYNSKYIDQVFNRYLSPVVILPHSPEEASQVAKILKEKQKTLGENSFISSVYSLDDFLPRDQSQKIALLRDIQKLLPERMVKRLSLEQQQQVKAFLTPENFQTVSAHNLPPLIREKFTEKDKSIGKLVLVEPPLGSVLWNGDNLVRFVRELREVADSVSPGTPVAGALPVTSDMFEAIRHDGPRATGFAFAAVIMLASFLFRNLRTISLVLFALIIGVVWLAGFMFFFDLKINFLNFIALPITFGIGVDYGVNIFQRYRQEGAGQILKAIRRTGGAVGLASLTTVIGYSSLLIAGNQAFVSFGKIAVLGELTCLIAAIFTLPAYLCFFDAKQEKTFSCPVET